MDNATLGLTVLQKAGVDVKHPGEEGWEEFRRIWRLNNRGEGSGFCVPNARTQTAYLSIGAGSNIVTVDVFFDRTVDAPLWSQWGQTFAA